MGGLTTGYTKNVPIRRRPLIVMWGGGGGRIETACTHILPPLKVLALKILPPLDSSAPLVAINNDHSLMAWGGSIP